MSVIKEAADAEQRLKELRIDLPQPAMSIFPVCDDAKFDGEHPSPIGHSQELDRPRA
jgi:hypothetical protein